MKLSGKIAVVTGGTGVLGSALCRALAAEGAKVAILGRRGNVASELAAEIGNDSIGVSCDVTDMESIKQAYDVIMEKYGKVDILINGAGGNNSNATTTADLKFFNLPADALGMVLDLNILGTILPSQVFGKLMAEQQEGIILNISSMNAFRPLTRIPGYSAAKAAISNFTQWLAVHMAQEYSPNIRVNAIAPGFFLTEQNRFLLTDAATGEMTPRGKSIISHTPMGRYGKPEELVGATIWLVSDDSSFVTGIVVPIDGGFSAFSGV